MITLVVVVFLLGLFLGSHPKVADRVFGEPGHVNCGVTTGVDS